MIIRKENWPPGPWHNEPDKDEWVDEATGLKCQIIRNELGALCGYVGVPDTNQHFGKHYDEVDVDTHGGLTYSREKSNVWWFGFDCAHAQDVMPAMQHWADSDSTYKDLEFVTNEVLNLAKQLNES